MDSKFSSDKDIFTCTKCGECCKGYGGTYVSESDIKKICGFINLDTALFIDKYCAVSGSKYLLGQKHDGSCVFYDKTEQCTIHPVKPHMCKAWPFLETIISNPENWNAMAGSCPGMKKHVPPEILKSIVKRERELL